MRLGTTTLVVAAAAVAVGLASALAPFASSRPDGLERVAQDAGFAGDGRMHALQGSSPIPDYAFPGISDPRLATGVAGFAGTVLILSCVTALAWLLRRRGRRAVGSAA